jgi:hypothetical protein
MSPDQVEQQLGQPGFHVYDNNSRSRWQRSHVPTAQYLDVGSMTADDLPDDLDATLVFYCSGPG